MPTSTTDATTTTITLPRPHAGQRSILGDARRFNVVNCGRRFGKTVLGINLACEAALPGGDRPGWPVGWFAPEYKLLREAWRDLNTLLDPVIASSNSQERRIELVNGGIIECWAFDRNPNAGRSRRYKRVVIDEAAHCENLEHVWTKAVRPTLTDYRGDAWFLSSPNGPNYFQKLYDRGPDPDRPAWRSWTRTTYDNPHIDPAEIDEAKLDLPEFVFEQEYLAVFHKESHGQLIPDAWLDRMANDAILRTVEKLRADGKGGRRRLAMDLGEGTGRDKTVAAAADDLGLLELIASNRIGIPEAAQLGEGLCRKWGIRDEDFTYDAGGRGKDLPRYLEQFGLDGATPYRGGKSGGEKFANLRTRCAWRFRQRLDPERPNPLPPPPERPPDWKPSPFDEPLKPAPITIQPPFALPPGDRSWWPAMREELQALRYGVKGKVIELEKKEDMAKRLGHSPDYADTMLMLSTAGSAN
jgi:hypothetical protein